MVTTRGVAHAPRRRPPGRWPERERRRTLDSMSRFRTLPLLVLVAGCAGGPHLVELTSWTPPRGQRCWVSGPDGGLDVMLDPAALAERIAGLGLPDGTLLMSVAVDSGEVRRLRPIETSLGEASFRLESAIAEAVTAPTDTVARGRLVVRVRDGAVDTLALSASQYCRPAAANVDEVEAELERTYERLRMTGSAKLRMYVDARGRVAEVEVARSSGYPALDEHLLIVARSVRFHPARIDRAPVGVWVAMDFTVESGGPANPWGGIDPAG